MSGLKRGGKSRGIVRGHRFGVSSNTLLGYRDARLQIYLPAYKWILENKVVAQIKKLGQILTDKPLVLLDYETNTDPEDLDRSLSHTALVKYCLEGNWPTP